MSARTGHLNAWKQYAAAMPLKNFEFQSAARTCPKPPSEANETKRTPAQLCSLAYIKRLLRTTHSRSSFGEMKVMALLVLDSLSLDGFAARMQDVLHLIMIIKDPSPGFLKQYLCINSVGLLCDSGP